MPLRDDADQSDLAGKYVSLYDLRVRLVQKALRDHSDLDDKASFDLAEHVLDALDHIPEQSR